MEKLTLTRLGKEKAKNGQNGAYYTIGFQTKEQGERWYDFNYNKSGNHGLSSGMTAEFEITERQGSGQWAGNTYYTAKLPKSSHQVNKMGGEDMVKLHAKLDAIWTKLGVIQGLIQPKIEEPRREFDTTDEREADIKPEDMPW